MKLISINQMRQQIVSLLEEYRDKDNIVMIVTDEKINDVNMCVVGKIHYMNVGYITIENLGGNRITINIDEINEIRKLNIKDE